MKTKEEVQPERSMKSDILDPSYAENLRRKQAEYGVPAGKREAAEKAWMDKLASGDYEGPTLDRSRYLTMRNKDIVGNPRQTEEYRRLCKEAVGVGETADATRYGHLEKADMDVIRWVVARGSGCMWLPDSARTTEKRLRHRKGLPSEVSSSVSTEPILNASRRLLTRTRR